jgi:hypothetical protein
MGVSTPEMDLDLAMSLMYEDECIAAERAAGVP